MAYDSWNRKRNDKKRFKHVSWRGHKGEHGSRTWGSDDEDYGYINNGYVATTKTIVTGSYSYVYQDEVWDEETLGRYIELHHKRLNDDYDWSWYRRGRAMNEIRELPEVVRSRYLTIVERVRRKNIHEDVDIPEEEQYIQKRGRNKGAKWYKKNASRRLRNYSGYLNVKGSEFKKVYSALWEMY